MQGGDVEISEEDQTRINKIYGFPLCQPCLTKISWLKYVPFCPAYGTKAQDTVDTDSLVSLEVCTTSKEHIIANEISQRESSEMTQM